MANWWVPGFYLQTNVFFLQNHGYHTKHCIKYCTGCIKKCSFGYVGKKEGSHFAILSPNMNFKTEAIHTISPWRLNKATVCMTWQKYDKRQCRKLKTSLVKCVPVDEIQFHKNKKTHIFPIHKITHLFIISHLLEWSYLTKSTNIMSFDWLWRLVNGNRKCRTVHAFCTFTCKTKNLVTKKIGFKVQVQIWNRFSNCKTLGVTNKISFCENVSCHTKAYYVLSL